MRNQTLRNLAMANFLRVIPGPFGRYRRRYRFYERIKNSRLVLSRKIRHSGIVVPLNLGDWVQYWMFMEGAYEKHLVDFLKPHVNGKIFFDVGANVGSYTLSLARSAARIYAFEASPSNAEILRSFVAPSGLNTIEVINNAVSSQAGNSIQIYSSPDTGGNNSTFHDFGEGGETVSTVTLDQFVAEHSIDRVGVIKVDVEGAELAVFQGAREVLRTGRPVLLVEFHALVAKQANWHLAELYDLLVGHRYNVYELVKGKLKPFDASRLSNPEFYSNLIFLPS